MAALAGAALGLLIYLIPFLIWIGFLLSLNKLVDVSRIDTLPQTNISKLWVWTQLIPGWGFIALIVLNIKLSTAVRAIESEFNLPFKDIGYPATFGWLVIFGALYAWIPIIGAIALVIFMILFWVKISSTSKQLIQLKATNQETTE